MVLFSSSFFRHCWLREFVGGGGLKKKTSCLRGVASRPFVSVVVALCRLFHTRGLRMSYKVSELFFLGGEVIAT